MAYPVMRLLPAPAGAQARSTCPAGVEATAVMAYPPTVSNTEELADTLLRYHRPG